MTVQQPAQSTGQAWKWLRTPAGRACCALLSCLVALACLEAAVRQQRQRWANYCPDDYRERLSQCRQGAPELVAVGGSTVTEGIDPAILTGVRMRDRPLRRVLNFGLLGGTASEFWHAVKHGVRTPPVVLLYGATASDVNDSRQEPRGADALMDWEDLADWVRHRPASAEFVTRHFLKARLRRCCRLYQHHDAIRLWLGELAESLQPGLCPETAREARAGCAYAAELRGGGYAPQAGFRHRHYDQVKAAGDAPERLLFLEKFRLGEHLAQLYRLIDWCEARGVTFVVVDMPVAEDLSQKLHPREFASYRAALAEMAKARGVQVIGGARQGAGLTDHDFADLLHLNPAGARKFSRWLRARLDEPGAGPRFRK
jgi:hypothetical protein